MKNLTFLICCLLVLLALTSGNLESATFIVTNTNDTGVGSLRWAMTSANNDAGHDTVNFNISGAGPHYIFPQSQLPPLTDPMGLFINGLTQTGASPGSNPPSTATLMIVIDGINAGPSHGIWIVSPFNEIHGLVINNFEQDGIRIQATPDGTIGNYIYCNFVGTNYTGTATHGNGLPAAQLWAGIYIICVPGYPGNAYDNFVEANLVSANYAEGVGIANCPPGDVAFNIVFHNYIGTDITGTIDFGNSHDGVYIGEGAHDNAVDANLIAGNDFEGVCIVGYAELGIFTNYNLVVNNTIGLDINLNPLGNSMDGISIGQYGNMYQGGYSQGNIIDTNTIAYNGNNGITVWEYFSNPINADSNLITRNFIYDNTLLGIDLGDNGVTANDGGDPDTGPNGELNFPVITSANYSAGQTAIVGTIDIDTDPTQAFVEVFKARQDPTNYGEGEIYLGFTGPDGAGNWNINVTGLVPGDLVTATTTDINLNTSEFCLNYVVTGVGKEESYAEKPLKYKLFQNYPNPFTKTTVISFQCSVPSDNTEISLHIYDLSGRLVKSFSLTTDHSALGTAVSWDGKNDRGERVAPGVYFYKLKTESFSATKKMILMR